MNLSKVSIKRFMDENSNIQIIPMGDSIEAKVDYTKTIDTFVESIGYLKKKIHGLPLLDEKFIQYGYCDEPSKEELLERSDLWRGKYTSEPIQSKIFMGRFISSVLTVMEEDIRLIIDNEVKYYKKKDDYNIKKDLLQQIVQCIGSFLMKVYSGKGYTDELFKIFELLTVYDKDGTKNGKKVMKVMEKELRRLDAMLVSGFFVGEKVSDDVILQNTCLLAYVLATGNPDVSNTFMVPETSNIKDKDSVKEVIQMLGYAIMDNRITIPKLPDMYVCFLSSLPKIEYRFKDINYNLCLREGCRALSYLYFVCGSDKLKRIIKRIIY